MAKQGRAAGVPPPVHVLAQPVENPAHRALGLGVHQERGGSPGIQKEAAGDEGVVAERC